MIQQTPRYVKRPLSGDVYSTIYPNNSVLDYDERVTFLPANGPRQKPWHA